MTSQTDDQLPLTHAGSNKVAATVGANVVCMQEKSSRSLAPRCNFTSMMWAQNSLHVLCLSISVINLLLDLLSRHTAHIKTAALVFAVGPKGHAELCTGMASYLPNRGCSQP